MGNLLHAVEVKVRNFVKNSDAFKRVCDQTYDALDYRGRVTVDVAASCVENLFRELQNSCDEYGIVLDPLTSDNVRAIFQECDYDSNARLSKEEFQDFYSRVVTYAAVKACTGFTQKYGTGIIAGIVGTFVVKRIVRALPVVGLVAKPFLGLMPSMLVGPVLGVAVVYGLEKGDLFAIRHKLFPRRKAKPVRA